MVNPMTTADAIVGAWHNKLPTPLSPIDLSALRTYVAQALVTTTADKDREIEELKRRLAAINSAAAQGLQGSDRS